MKHLEAGQDLDILIATKIMGLIVVKTKSGSKRGGYYYTIGAPHWDDFAGDMQLSNPVPHYSTDLNTAWEVVDKLFDLQFDLSLEYYLDADNKRMARVDFAHMSKQELSYLEFSESVPHAICLAALITLGAK